MAILIIIYSHPSHLKFKVWQKITFPKSKTKVEKIKQKGSYLSVGTYFRVETV